MGARMITIRRLSDCSLSDILKAWNNGFAGYFVKMEFTTDQFLNRLVQEGLSTDLSIVAFDEDIPVGIVLNGVRFYQDKKIAWNGGTGVDKNYRQRGIGKRLIEETLKIYHQEGIESATLEAISENKPAIALYEKLGYKITDRILHLVKDGELHFPKLHVSYRIEKCLPRETACLPFYQSRSTWQTQWQSVKDGEALLLYNHNDEAVAYAIYKRIWDESDNIKSIYLYQLECRDDQSLDVFYVLLKEIFQYPNTIKHIINFSLNHLDMYTILNQLGFVQMVEQVRMERVV